MKHVLIISLFISSALISAKVELLDKIAIIVDDGLVMESQINDALSTLEKNYSEQNIKMPPKEVLIDQVKDLLFL